MSISVMILFWKCVLLKHHCNGKSCNLNPDSKRLQLKVLQNFSFIF